MCHCSLFEYFRRLRMVLKNIFVAIICAALLAWSGLAMADEYCPDEFLGLDLSKAVLSPKPLGPASQFVPVQVEARTDRGSEGAQASAESKAEPKAVIHKPGLVNDDFGLGFRFRACLRALASAIGSCFDLDRHELRGRPKRLRRKHGLGKIEAEELVGTVLIRHCQTAPCQQRRANDGNKNIFQDHSKPPEILKEGTVAHLRSGLRNSSRCCRQGCRVYPASKGLVEQAPIQGRWNRCDRGTFCFLDLEKDVFRWRQGMVIASRRSTFRRIPGC